MLVFPLNTLCKANQGKFRPIHKLPEKESYTSYNVPPQPLIFYECWGCSSSPSLRDSQRYLKTMILWGFEGPRQIKFLLTYADSPDILSWHADQALSVLARKSGQRTHYDDFQPRMKFTASGSIKSHDLRAPFLLIFLPKYYSKNNHPQYTGSYSCVSLCVYEHTHLCSYYYMTKALAYWEFWVSVSL